MRCSFPPELDVLRDIPQLCRRLCGRRLLLWPACSLRPLLKPLADLAHGCEAHLHCLQQLHASAMCLLAPASGLAAGSVAWCCTLAVLQAKAHWVRMILPLQTQGAPTLHICAGRSSNLGAGGGWPVM